MIVWEHTTYNFKDAPNRQPHTSDQECSRLKIRVWHNNARYYTWHWLAMIYQRKSNCWLIPTWVNLTWLDFDLWQTMLSSIKFYRKMLYSLTLKFNPLNLDMLDGTVFESCMNDTFIPFYRSAHGTHERFHESWIQINSIFISICNQMFELCLNACYEDHDMSDQEYSRLKIQNSVSQHVTLLHKVNSNDLRWTCCTCNANLWVNHHIWRTEIMEHPCVKLCASPLTPSDFFVCPQKAKISSPITPPLRPPTLLSTYPHIALHHRQHVLFCLSCWLEKSITWTMG